MTLKIKDFDWDIVVVGLVVAFIVCIFTFFIGWVFQFWFLTNAWEQTLIGNSTWSEYDIPLYLTANNEIKVFGLSALHAFYVVLIVFPSIVALFVICAIIQSIEKV